MACYIGRYSEIKNTAAGSGCNRKHVGHVRVVKRDTVGTVEETLKDGHANLPEVCQGNLMYVRQDFKPNIFSCYSYCALLLVI